MTLIYPNKSHRKRVRLPRNSAKLAEFMGIMAGDGGLSNPWQITITMNAKKDLEYSKYIQELLYELFRVQSSILLRERNTLRIVVSSVSIREFIIKKGFPNGHKINLGIDIPLWVLKRPAYYKAFVRGLIDTDGCIYIHKHTVLKKNYLNIGLCYSCYAPKLLRSVQKCLGLEGIDSKIAKDRTSIYLFKEPKVVKYLSIFGSSNPRITNKFEEYTIRRGVREA